MTKAIRNGTYLFCPEMTLTLELPRTHDSGVRGEDNEDNNENNHGHGHV
jgi:hypothetical protein